MIKHLDMVYIKYQLSFNQEKFIPWGTKYQALYTIHII